VPGLQAKAETSTGAAGATKLNVVLWEAPFKVAVMVAVWFVAIVPAVAVKLAEMVPAAKVTEAGTVSEALLSERATTVPPAGAA